ncbi:MAG TPA: hypothetical protein VMA30_01070 [Xanthobacteraceae bacterium]|nr:hypothetical protein [Xanthobacteraceae bacterium]
MVATAVLALIGGALLGTRFNVRALLVCLGAIVVLMTATMSLASYSLISTMGAAFIILTGVQIGYLAGAYASEAGMSGRALRPSSCPVNR